MSVIESKYPVLIISFNNCELHCCHLDGYKGNKDAVTRRLSQIELFFNTNLRYRVWYNVDDTILSDEIIELITGSILKLKDSIVKIAFIGLGRKKRRFHKALMKTLITTKFPVEYFSDAELAKEWLK